MPNEICREILLHTMDTDENIPADTPDLDFSESQIDDSQNIIHSEEQVERILGEFEEETPDLEFSEAIVELTDEAPKYTEDDEDIDDLDEPDQYVDEDESATEGNENENETNNINGGANKTGKLLGVRLLLLVDSSGLSLKDKQNCKPILFFFSF